MIVTIYFGIKLVDEFLIITKFIFKLIFPILLGFVIAFILNPLKRYFKKRRLSNTLATVLAMIIFIVLIALVFVLILPNMIKELGKFVNQIPKYMLYVEMLINKISTKMLKDFDVKQYLNSIFLGSFDNLTVKIISFFQTIISYSISIIMAVFIAIYLLLDYEEIIVKIKELIKKSKSKKLYNFISDVKSSMYTYLKGLFQVNAILFLGSSILFWLIGLDYFYIIALIFAITNVIPYLGPYIGGGFAVLIALNYSNDKAFLAFLVVVLLQFIDNYILSPKVQASNISVKPVIIIISIFIMGTLFGIIGMVLAVPMASIINNFIHHFMIKADEN